MTETSDEMSIIALLEKRVATAETILSKPKVGNGQVIMWSGAVRKVLCTLFGQKGVAAVSWVHTSVPDNADPRQELVFRMKALLFLISRIRAAEIDVLSRDRVDGRVFIGHGGSPIWRELKDFLSDRLVLPWDEFNREAVAGLTTNERITDMLDEASFAFLVMTGEDELADMTTHARQNVVHEVGLFQGRLGPRRAVILLEEGCSEFSNIVGLSQIRFPKGQIAAVFEQIRRVLEREGIVDGT